MTSDTLQQLGALMIPVLVAILTVPLFELIQKINAWIDSLNPTIKRLIYAVIAAVGNWFFVLIGAAPITNPTGLNQVAVGTLLTTMLGYLLHLAMKLHSIQSPNPPSKS